MDRVRARANDYDVLGLAPDASEDEIELAFDWLVRRRGFRQSLPRRQWPQRLREIQSAYATLRDPDKRRAYDESLREASDSWVREWKVAAGGSTKEPPRKRRASKNSVPEPVLVGAGSDAATESLITPGRPQRTRKAANANGPAADANEGRATDAAAPGRQSSQRINVRQRRQRVTDLPPDESAATEKAWAHTSGRGSKDAGARQAQSPAWAGAYRTSYEPRSLTVKHGGIAALVALALGGLLLAYWPHEKPKPFETAGSSTSPANIEPSGPVQPPKLASEKPVTDSTSSEALSPQERAAAESDAGPASASLRDWTETKGSLESAIPAPQAVPDSADAAISSPQTRQPATPLTITTPSVAPAPPVSQPPQTAAIVPKAPIAVSNGRQIMAVPPAAAATRPTGGPATSQATAKVFATPPTWVSGGPTDADNRRGRYRGAVSVRFTVGVDGRPSNCSIARSSGNGDLDALTCRLVVERARFTPARDVRGQVVARDGIATYVWGRGHRPKK